MTTPRRRPLIRKSRRGQSTVEMALVFPVCLAVMLGIIEFSRALFSYSIVANAAREGARYGIMHPTWEDSDDNADPDNIEYRARRLTTGLDADRLTLRISFPDTTKRTGDRLRVTAIYAFRMIYPLFDINLRSSATMRIE